MMKHKNVWVLVADEAIARILTWPEFGNELDSVEELTDPNAHAKGAEFRHDAEGRRAGGTPPSIRPGASGARTAHSSVTSSAGENERHVEAEQFARRVASHLAEALNQKRFDELRLVAAPRFLGLLRKALSAQVAGLVTTELDKDFVHLTNDDISRRLPRPVPKQALV